MAFARNVLHSVFSEKQGSQPKAGWTVAFRRSIKEPLLQSPANARVMGYGLQGRAVQGLSGFCSFKVVLLMVSLGVG